MTTTTFTAQLAPTLTVVYIRMPAPDCLHVLYCDVIPCHSRFVKLYQVYIKCASMMYTASYHYQYYCH
jgi:hypothetical protein